MTRNIFKSVLFPSLLMGLLFLAIPHTLAADYSVHELKMEKKGDLLLSPIVFEESSFNAVALDLEEDVDGLQANFSPGSDAWEDVEVHDDGFGAGRLVFTRPTFAVQFRIPAGNRQSLSLKATVFFEEALEEGVGGYPSQLEASTTQIARSYTIIKRNEWGADEELRIWNPDRAGDEDQPYVNPCAEIESKYGNEVTISTIKDYTPDGQPLTWPLQYTSNLEKFVVHHTDSDVRDMNGDYRTDTRDYEAMVRAIYYYHAISRGWGDIGYNYIIDPLGNIYEGRYGGDKVIGAHALCFNQETMGIAIIGDYENNEVPEPAVQAAIWLIGTKAKQFGINPEAASTFRGKNLPNVFGHKDVRTTACPGSNLYALLPYIRERASLLMRNFSESTVSGAEFDYNAELVTSLSPLSVGPGERKKVTLKFKNTGSKTWDNNTWLHVALNNDPNARIVSVVEDTGFVAADLKENSVAPGSTGTFEVEVEGGFKPGFFSFQLSPVVNGRYKISRASTYITFNVEAPNYDYEIVSHEFPMGTVFQGQHTVANLALKNTGNVTWRNFGANAITLGTEAPRDRESIFIKDNPYRVGYMIDSEVSPGETGHFELNLFVPEDREGEVIERFTPVIENVAWLADKALGFKVYVKEPVHLARSVKLNRLGYMYPGERRYVRVQMENLGDLPWDAQTVQTTLLGRGMKVFKRMLLPEEEIAPGEKQIVGFWVEAPLVGGQHTIYLRSRFNGQPIRGAVAQYVVEVPSPELRGVKAEQSEPLAFIKPRQTKEFTVQFRNTGNTVWKKKGYHAVHLGTSNPNDRQSQLFHKASWLDPYRAAELQEEEVLPGETGTFKFKAYSDVMGRFEEDFQLVMEHYGWITGATVKWIVNVTDSASTTSSTTTLTASTQEVATTTSTSTSTTTSKQPFRVRINHGANVATLTANTAFVVLNQDDQVLFNLSAGTEVSAARLAGGFQVKSGETVKNAQIVQVVPKETNGIVEILTMERRPSWNTALNDNRFRGTMEMRVIDGETAYINELPLEDYLKGLAEVSNGDHPEKQKTIAVLARTYARFYMDPANRKFPGMPYDGSDDPAIFQRYLGYGVEARSPNFVSAVEATKNKVVTYQGALIKTPYFNQSDGRTRSAKEVWGWTNTPYLVSVPDPWCEGLTLNGHGVGLSGCGATAQAKEGKTFEEIIKYYYTGVALEAM